MRIFSRQSKYGKDYLLKSMFYEATFVGIESTKIDYSEGSVKYEILSLMLQRNYWNILKKFHEGSVVEHEIALATYWNNKYTKMGELEGEDQILEVSNRVFILPEVAGESGSRTAFTDIGKLRLGFQRKKNPAKKLLSYNTDRLIPRESKGSAVIDKKMSSDLGL